MAKELYNGPTFLHGQTMRTTVMHIKGHGHAARLLTGRTKGMGRATTKARIKKKAQQAFL